MASRIGQLSESAAAPPEARSHSPWRRSACDRCRSQKLRCTRKKEDDTTTPCTRCLRIRFPCFTSPAKPPGRLAHRRPTTSEPPLCTDPSRHLAVAGVSGHGIPVSLSSTEPLYVPWPYYQPDGRSTAMEDGVLALSWPGDHHGINPYNFTADSTLIFDNAHSFASQIHAPADPALSTAPVASVTVSRAPPQGMEMLLFDNKSCASKSHSGYGQEQAHIVNQSCVLDPGLLLSGLQQSLSKQLYNIKASPQGFSVLNSTSSQLAEDNYGFNPLNLVLGSTVELLSIAQLFVAPDDAAGSPPPAANLSDYDPTPHMADEGSIQGSQWPSPASNTMPYQPSQIPTQYSSASSAASSPASTAIDPALLPSRPDLLNQPVLSSTYLLTLVSCYVQLLSIYDAIFACILVEVHNSSMQQQLDYSNPAYHPAQFNSEYAVNHQRARSIAQMVDQRLDNVEQSLGLPREYSVSTTASGGFRSGQGLLAGAEARAFLEILLGSPGVASGSGAGLALPGGQAESLMFEESSSDMFLEQHLGFNGTAPSKGSAAHRGLGGDVVVDLRDKIRELLSGMRR
ncbi:hypothetical protein QBC43DRAFT_219856 [Cladorrhinum sp. PSN259]|nr:hypothetical protein QBC43DRAFT_219856 [Cladorrhinum sp. PSN259]